MAEIKVLEERVVKAEEKVEKCKGTIERHKKQLDKKVLAFQKRKGITLDIDNQEQIDALKWADNREEDDYWNLCDIESKKNDIKGATRKLLDAETILGNWKEKLSIEVNNDKFLEDNAPQVIKDFLNEWKQKAYEWHIRRFNDFQKFKVKIEKEHDEAIINYVKSNPEVFARYLDENGEIEDYWARDLINIRGKGLEVHLKENELDWRSKNSRKSHFAGAVILRMDGMYDKEERLAWLEKTLESERKAKMLDLIQRISKVVGEITDASYLKISMKGNIDGFVIGTQGKAKVNTIGAGGWNIQCWHYRTLVTEME